MPGQAFIDEGVFRIQQFEYALIAQQDALEQQLRFLDEGLPETGVEIAEEDRIRVSGFCDSQLQPLGPKVGGQVARAWIG